MARLVVSNDNAEAAASSIDGIEGVEASMEGVVVDDGEPGFEDDDRGWGTRNWADIEWRRHQSKRTDEPNDDKQRCTVHWSRKWDIARPNLVPDLPLGISFC